MWARGCVMTHFNHDLTKPEKFREAILYVSQKCETDPKFGMTKLNKILFYADFIQFSRTGESITGQSYQKLNFGPAPRAMKPVCDSMEAEKELVVKGRHHYSFIQNKPIALREPHLEVFSSSEIAIIDEVIEHVWRLSASEISDASHGFIGWQIMDFGETIPYGLAWIDVEPEFTEAELETISKLKPLSDEEKKNLQYRL
jgi:hypothetical protein